MDLCYSFRKLPFHVPVLYPVGAIYIKIFREKTADLGKLPIESVKSLLLY